MVESGLIAATRVIATEDVVDAGLGAALLFAPLVNGLAGLVEPPTPVKPLPGGEDAGETDAADGDVLALAFAVIVIIIAVAGGRDLVVPVIVVFALRSFAVLNQGGCVIARLNLVLIGRNRGGAGEAGNDEEQQNAPTGRTSCLFQGNSLGRLQTEYLYH